MRSLNLILTALVVLVGCCLATARPAAAQSLPATATKLYIYNPSSPKTVVMCTSGVTPLSNIFVRRVSPNPTTGQALTVFGGGAYFMIAPGERWTMYNNTSPYTLQAVAIGFGQFPNVCPKSQAAGINQTPCTFFPPSPGYPNGFPSGGCCPNAFPQVSNPSNTIYPDLPNGSNSAEITINVASGPETIDLSCNNGANCKLRMTITPPANGPYWTTNVCSPPASGSTCSSTQANTTCLGSGSSTNCTRTFMSTTAAENSWVNVAAGADDNCVDSTGCPRNGVGPYGCSQCNLNPDPSITCANGTGGASGVCEIVTANYTGQYCAAQNGNGKVAPTQGLGCNFIRNPAAGQAFGGTIQITYLGPLSPPSSLTPVTPKCPSLAQ